MRRKREKANIDVRNYAKQNGVYLWEIADAIGKSYDGLIRELRHELQEDEKKELLVVIDAIIKNNKGKV